MRSSRHVAFQFLMVLAWGTSGCGSGKSSTPGGVGGTAGAILVGGVAGGAGVAGALSTAGTSGGSAGTASVSGASGAGGTTGEAGAAGSTTSTAGAAGTTGAAGAATEDAPGSAVSYEPSSEVILNPERGFFTTTNLATVRNLNGVRSQGKTLVFAAVALDAYLGSNHAQDLPQKLLDDVQAGFDAVREAGIKAVVRFRYDNGEGYPGGANDAPESWMIKHIQQVAPVLKNNEDVLFVLHAGFIGAWGEWHTSQNFSDGPQSKDPRKRIVDALLAATPASRRVTLRYPAYKRMFYGTAATTETELLAGGDVSRAGHLNDCFVSSNDDVGTYQYEPMDQLKAYLADDTKYTPIGGETCAVDARNACDATTGEMQRFHWTFINDDYHPDVLARWDTEGCRPDIERKLGYRLALDSGTLPSAARPGGSFTLELNVTNEGWAAFTNPRPVFLVLEGQGERLFAELPTDPRTWQPGPIKLRARLRLPATLPASDYRLALWLPDAATALRGRAEYSVQLANEGVWNEALGDNTLGQLTVSPSAAGDADPAATTFSIIQ